MSKKVRNVGLTEDENFYALENLQDIQRLPSISPVNLNYYGAEQCLPGSAFGPFVRTSYLIHFVKSGRGCLFKENRKYDIESGQAFLIYPGEETVYKADEKEPWSYLWVGFHGLLVSEMMQRAGFTEEEPVITCENMDQIIDTMMHLLSCEELTYINELSRMGDLYRIISLITMNNSNSEAEARPELDADSLYVKTAVNLLINSKDPQIKVSDVADTIGISRGYLTSIFKKKMKVSPQQFLINFRMEKAGNLLTSTDNPVGVIASELGYTDVMTFSKSFKKHFGVSPSEYREQKVVLVTGTKKGSYTSDNPL